MASKSLGFINTLDGQYDSRDGDLAGLPFINSLRVLPLFRLCKRFHQKRRMWETSSGGVEARRHRIIEPIDHYQLGRQAVLPPSLA